MNKNLLSVLGMLTLGVALAGCSFTVPKRVSVKSKAEYNFTLASFEKNLGETIGLDLLTESSSSGDDIRIYDYNPGGDCKTQHYLIKIPLMSVPVDMSSYIGDLTMDSLNVNQKIKIPEISFNKESELELTELTDKLNGMVKFCGPLNSEKMVITAVSDKGESFENLNYESGTMDVYVQEVTSPNAYVILDTTSGIESAYFEQLPEVVEKTITINGVSQKISASYKASLDLSNRSVSMNGMTLTFSNCNLSYGNYFYGEISKESKIRTASGVNYSTEQNLSPQIVSVDFPDDVKNMEIELAELTTKMSVPSTWYGTDMKFTYSVYSGEEEWIKDSNNETEIIRDKKLTSADLKVVPKVNVNLTNAKIYFSDKSTLKIACDVEKLKSVTFDEEKMGLKNNLQISDIDFPEDTAKIIKEIWFGETDIKVSSTNTLPEGNDISVKISSKFMNLSESVINLKAGSNDVTSDMKATSDDLTKEGKKTEGAKIDFNPELIMPGQNGDGTITIVGIEPGTEYVVALNIVPDIKWLQVRIDSSAIPSDMSSPEGGLDTGFNMGNMLSGIENLSGESTGNISIGKIPLYVFCNNGGIQAFENIKINGFINLNNDKQSLSLLPYEDGSNEMKFVNKLPNFSGNEDGIVDDKLTKEESSIYVDDITALFDSEAEESIKLNYGLKVSGKSAEGDLLIKSEGIEKNAGLEIVAVIDLPLIFKIKKPIEISMDTLLKKDSTTIESDPSDPWANDLLGRNGPMDITEYREFIDAIEKVEIQLISSQFPLFYETQSGEDAKNIMLSIDYDPESGNPADEFPIDATELTLDAERIKNILEKPFTPVLSVTLPEGDLNLSRGLSLKAKVNFKFATNGTVKIWEQE